ncbi:MAG: hypothetical protein JXA96_01960 [Sedimentisphaerales bacterium]|nr:hypothetical protein [Sedimentisphaerales bacterium]
MTKEILGKYELTELNEAIIDVSLKNVEDIFSNFSGNKPDSPKILSQEFVDFIIDSANEIGENKLIIRISIQNIPDEKVMDNIESSIQSHFNNLKDLENRSIEMMFSRSIKLFGLGMLFLFIAIIFNRLFYIRTGTISQVFYEGITIAGWISLWAAIITIVVKWPPQKNNIKLYERIMKAKIIFIN